jgi:hypothetical protein
MNTLGELKFILGVDAETYKVKDFVSAIGTLPLAVAGGIAALGGMSLSLIDLTSGIMDMGTQLREFKATTGEATDPLEKWQMVARRVGLSNDVATGSFSRMISAIAQLQTFGTGPAAEMFGRLGITGVMQKSPYALMDELRSAYHRAQMQGPTAVQGFMQKSGGLIDPAMALMFSSRLSSPENMAKMNPLLGKEGIDTTAQLTQELSELNDILRGEFIKVFQKIEPELGNIAEFLGDLIRIGGTALGNVAGMVKLGKGIYNLPQKGEFLSGLANYYTGQLSTGWNYWQPARQSQVTVNQHFYGDVDKGDIDAGRLDLEHSLVRASRMLNKGGR